MHPLHLSVLLFFLWLYNCFLCHLGSHCAVLAAVTPLPDMETLEVQVQDLSTAVQGWQLEEPYHKHPPH